MLILDISSYRFSEPNTEQQDSYPDQVLESEWNPILTEIQSVQSSHRESSKPAPEVVDSALAWLYHN